MVAFSLLLRFTNGLRLPLFTEDLDRLDFYFQPIFWVGVLVLLLWIGTGVLASNWHHISGVMPLVLSVSAVYFGIALALMAALSLHVFCDLISGGGFTAQQIDSCKHRQLSWLLEIAFLWGTGIALAGFVWLIAWMVRHWREKVRRHWDPTPVVDNRKALGRAR